MALKVLVLIALAAIAASAQMLRCDGIQLRVRRLEKRHSVELGPVLEARVQVVQQRDSGALL